jgi:hypothetical protein
MILRIPIWNVSGVVSSRKRAEIVLSNAMAPYTCIRNSSVEFEQLVDPPPSLTAEPLRVSWMRLSAARYSQAFCQSVDARYLISPPWRLNSRSASWSDRELTVRPSAHRRIYSLIDCENWSAFSATTSRSFGLIRISSRSVRWVRICSVPGSGHESPTAPILRASPSARRRSRRALHVPAYVNRLRLYVRRPTLSPQSRAPFAVTYPETPPDRLGHGSDSDTLVANVEFYGAVLRTDNVPEHFFRNKDVKRRATVGAIPDYRTKPGGEQSNGLTADDHVKD